MIHLSTARSILALKQPVTLTVVTSKGEIQTYENCTPLQADLRAGTRNIKLANNQIRKIRDSLILRLNDKEIYL